MPLYEYRCNQCCNSFEVLQSIGEGADGVRCPQCDSTEIARQLSTFSGMSHGGSSTSASAGCGTSGFS